MKKKLLIAIIIFAAVIIAAGAAAYFLKAKKKIENPVVKKDVLVVAAKGDILGFNPKMEGYETMTMSMNSNVFNSLTEFDKNYKVEPGLAVSWSNPDKLTWRFYLRKNVKFSNGDPFTAEDVKYTIEYVLNEKGNVLRDLVASVDKVEIVDEYTVDIKTKEPNPVMLNKLADILILPKRYPEIPASEWPVGTGPYKVKEYVKGDHLTLERVDTYWGKPSPIKTIEVKIMPDDQERTSALLTKKVDIAESITQAGYDSLKNKTDIIAVAIPGTRILYFSFDFRENDSHGFPGKKNPTADVRVRKAMYLAIDEDKIINEVMSGAAEPASQFISPNFFGYNPEIKRPAYNLTEAKKLMKEAGYENGFEIQLDCPNNRYMNDEAICKEVVEQLKDLNIKVNLSAVNKADHFPKILERRTAFYMLGWIADTTDGGEIFDYLLHSVDDKNVLGGYNGGYYSNPEVDKLGEASSQIINSLERLKILQQGFKIAMDDVAWIPLHMQKNLHGVLSSVNWEPRADESFNFNDISFK